MNSIKVTEFSRPFAQRIEKEIQISDSAVELWRLLIARGGTVTIERIGNGQVNGCIEVPDLADYDMFVCPDEESRIAAELDDLLRRFDPVEFARWKRLCEAEL
jgi:hypothetical protein